MLNFVKSMSDRREREGVRWVLGVPVEDDDPRVVLGKPVLDIQSTTMRTHHRLAPEAEGTAWSRLMIQESRVPASLMRSKAPSSLGQISVPGCCPRPGPVHLSARGCLRCAGWARPMPSANRFREGHLDHVGRRGGCLPPRRRRRRSAVPRSPQRAPDVRRARRGRSYEPHRTTRCRPLPKDPYSRTDSPVVLRVEPNRSAPPSPTGAAWVLAIRTVEDNFSRYSTGPPSGGVRTVCASDSLPWCRTAGRRAGGRA